MDYLKSNNSYQGTADLFWLRDSNYTHYPSINKLLNPATNGRGAYIKLFSQLLMNLSVSASTARIEGYSSLSLKYSPQYSLGSGSGLFIPQAMLT